mgnify:CR=1 FL=1
MKKKIRILSFLFLLTLSFHMYAGHPITSPSGKIEAKLQMQNGQPLYSVKFNSTVIIQPSAMGLNLKDPFSGGFKLIDVKKGSVDTEWTPVWGEYEVIPDKYNSLKAVLKEQGPAGRRLIIEFRAYNEGLAFRYHMPDTKNRSWEVRSEKTAFQFIDGSAAYAIYHTEQEFPQKPIPLKNLDRRAMTPLTVKLPNGAFASVLEAFVKSYARSGIKPMQNGAVGLQYMSESVEGEDALRSPWRVILLGEDEGRLIENEHLDMDDKIRNYLEPWHLSKKLIITLNQEDNCGDTQGLAE